MFRVIDHRKIRMWKRSAAAACYRRPMAFGRNSISCFSGSEVSRNATGRAMSFFQCGKCGCVEDTALCRYWSARLRQTQTLCSACDPAIAKWHGQFPRESARDWIRDERGFACSRRDVESWLGQSIETISRP
jgi:hypothetical protein